MTTVAANELKTKGISALEKALKGDGEAIISVRGKRRFVVMELEKYDHLRECELEAALMASRRDMEKGRVYKDSVSRHIRRIVAT